MSDPSPSEGAPSQHVGASWTPSGVDTSAPHAARMYDYYLGGKDNFPADRAAADRALAAAPSLRVTAVENRGFLARAVEFLADEAGVTQFIDVGAGLPAAGATHEVARRVAPDSRVVCLDNDPVVLAHARDLLPANPPGVAFVRGDLRDGAALLADPTLRAVLDLTRPVALVLNAVLHFLSDDDGPHAVVAELAGVLPAGSHLQISHVTADHAPERWAALTRVYAESGVPVQARGHAEVLRFFDGMDLVDPGLVDVSRWRADYLPEPRPTVAEVSCLGAVARIS